MGRRRTGRDQRSADPDGLRLWRKARPFTESASRPVHCEAQRIGQPTIRASDSRTGPFPGLNPGNRRSRGRARNAA